MCRILAMMSSNPCGLRDELSFHENNFCSQSYEHPDGWGIAHYNNHEPQVVRSIRSAHSDALFETVARVVHSHVWLAHLRRATHGIVSLENAHPFHWGRFAFAHNGHIRRFDELKPQLFQSLDESLKGQRRGQTDSELIFHILLSSLKNHMNLDSVIEEGKAANVLLQSVGAITDIIGPLTEEIDRKNPTTQLTFVLSNSNQIYAFNGGRPIFYKLLPGVGFRLIIASEIIGNPNGWEMIPFGTLLSVNRQNFSIFRFHPQTDETVS